MSMTQYSSPLGRHYGEYQHGIARNTARRHAAHLEEGHDCGVISLPTLWHGDMGIYILSRIEASPPQG